MTRWFRWLLPPLLAFALYAPVLALPFFWDDIANAMFMHGHGAFEIWWTSAGFPYYRPLGFVPWQITEALFGRYNTVAFHSLNLIALVATGWLAGMLAASLATYDDERDLAALVGGVLMVSFPFAALVVPLVASLFHLQITLMALGAAVAMRRFQQRRQPAVAALAIILAGLTPFAHESGVATAGILAAVWLFGPVADRDTSAAWLTPQRRLGLVVVGTALLLNFAYLPWWQAIPKTRSEGGFSLTSFNLSDIWGNTTVFLMGLSHPLQPITQALAPQVGPDNRAVILTLAALTLAVLALLLWRTGLLHWLGLGLGYLFAGGLPTILALPFGYVTNSPRLLMFGGPGIVLLWTATALALARLTRVRQPRLAPAVALTATLLLCIVPARHILREVDLHTRTLAPVWQMVAAARGQPDSRQVVINPPSWNARSTATYPLLKEGVVVIAEYSTPQQLIDLHVAHAATVEGVEFPLVFTVPEAHYFDPWGPALDWDAMAALVRASDDVFLTRYGDGPLHLDPVGGPYESAPTVSPVATFDGGRMLLASATAVQRDATTVEITLDWQMPAASGEDVFSQVRDCAGNTLAQIDGAPLGGTFPIWLWQPGETVRDIRTLRFDQPPTDGCLQVIVGLFNPLDGTRPPATDAAGNPIPDSVVWLDVLPATE